MLRGIKNRLDGVLSRLPSGNALLQRDGVLGGRVTDPSDEADTRLFYCPACERVYVAAEKRICSSCETAVEPVSATVRETGNE